MDYGSFINILSGFDHGIFGAYDILLGSFNILGRKMTNLLGGGMKKKAGGQLDLLLKKLLNESGGEPRAIYILHDLSLNLVWDRTNEVQQERVRTWLEKEKQARKGILPEIYYHHSSIRTCLDLK